VVANNASTVYYDHALVSEFSGVLVQVVCYTLSGMKVVVVE